MCTFLKWTKKLTLGSFVLIIILAGMGTIYQYVATKIDEKKYPPPGHLVDVGSIKLHLHCTGKKGPTVIIDTGLGCDSIQWSLVQSGIEKFARVCSYDRAGYGWSNQSPYPRTSKQIVDELHTLLTNAKISPPYILVGHSFGGGNVQLYAKEYPNEVIGLVLVDSIHEKIIEKMPPEPGTWIEQKLSSPKFGLFLVRLGIPRLLKHSFENEKELKLFSEKTREIILSHQCLTKQMKAIVQEDASIKESLIQLENEKLSFGSMPLVVIAAGKAPMPEKTAKDWAEYSQKFFDVWRLLQQDLVKRSTKGKLVIAEKSDHMIHFHQPEIIVDSVKQLIAKSHR